MCEKRTRKITKGSQNSRLREARRLQRLQRVTAPPVRDENANTTQAVNRTAQNRLILELAWKTVALMHKNRLIQQKIVALQKETSEFIANIMSNPENKKRYIEHMRIYGQQMQNQAHTTIELKLEPQM